MDDLFFLCCLGIVVSSTIGALDYFDVSCTWEELDEWYRYREFLIMSGDLETVRQVYTEDHYRFYKLSKEFWDRRRELNVLEKDWYKEELGKLYPTKKFREEPSSYVDIGIGQTTFEAEMTFNPLNFDPESPAFTWKDALLVTVMVLTLLSF